MLPFLISTWYMDIDHLIRVARWCPSSSVSRHLVPTASSKVSKVTVTVSGGLLWSRWLGGTEKNVGNIHVGFVLSIFDDHSQFISCMVFDSFWAIEQIFGSVRCYLPMTVTPLYPDHSPPRFDSRNLRPWLKPCIDWFTAQALMPVVAWSELVRGVTYWLPCEIT